MSQICPGWCLLNFKAMNKLNFNCSKVFNALLVPAVVIFAIWQSDCSNCQLNWYEVPQVIISVIKLEQMLTEDKNDG